jgi:uncharacterized protein with beta-barrel porin domain
LVADYHAPAAFDQFSGEIHASGQTLLAQISQFAQVAKHRHDVQTGINIRAEALGSW